MPIPRPRLSGMAVGPTRPVGDTPVTFLLNLHWATEWLRRFILFIFLVYHM